MSSLSRSKMWSRDWLMKRRPGGGERCEKNDSSFVACFFPVWLIATEAEEANACWHSSFPRFYFFCGTAKSWVSCALRAMMSNISSGKSFSCHVGQHFSCRNWLFSPTLSLLCIPSFPKHLVWQYFNYALLTGFAAEQLWRYQSLFFSFA